MIVYADVARYKYGPLWISVDQLYSAMLTMDSTSRQFRGFLVLSTKDISSDLDVPLVASSNEDGGFHFSILAFILFFSTIVMFGFVLAFAYKSSPCGQSRKGPKSYDWVGSSTHASDAGLGLAPLSDKRTVQSDAANRDLPSSSHSLSQSASRSHEEEVEEGTTTISVESSSY
jgi:hypothetical protein